MIGVEILLLGKKDAPPSSFWVSLKLETRKLSGGLYLIYKAKLLTIRIFKGYRLSKKQRSPFTPKMICLKYGIECTNY